MSSREENKEDSSREESFEVVAETVTPHEESRRTRADPEESDVGTPSVEELRQRAQRIVRQGIDLGSQEESSRPVDRRELQFERGNQGRQESDEPDNQSQAGQGSNVEVGHQGDNDSTMSVSAPTVQGVPTVSKDAADMFKTSAPRDKDLYKEGGCQFPRSEGGMTHKEIKKVKEKEKRMIISVQTKKMKKKAIWMKISVQTKKM